MSITTPESMDAPLETPRPPANGTAHVTSPFKPRLMRIAEAHDETADVRTLRLSPADGDPLPSWRAGQFGEFSVFGTGEAVFTVANSPSRDQFLECSYRAVGKVTHALRNLAPGQIVGFRGPYGNSFDVEGWKGRDIAFVGGGIGTVALRSAIQWVLDHKPDYGDVVILNGARSVSDLCYRSEMPDWAQVRGVRVVRTVDPGGEAPGWDGEVGLLPAVFEKLGLSASGRTVVSCGPPVMLHYLFMALGKLGYQPAHVVTTMENKMKCGLGLCGRCNAGEKFVCVDGPVFTWAQVDAMPKDY
jgi:NAD(P)H-flavin reductase